MSRHPSHSSPSPGSHTGTGTHPTGSGGSHHHPPGSGANPYPIRGGSDPWPRWTKPGFVPVAYTFNWNDLTSVTCVAQNATGNAYPVVEDGYIGVAFEGRLPVVEQAALDRCYSDTGGDASCALTACTPTYL